MPLEVSRIQALCFDVDGTLSDTDDLYVQRLSHFLHPLRFLFRKRDTQRTARRLIMWSETPANLLMGVPDALGLDDELLAMAEWLNRHRPRPKKDFLIVPGVQDMLTRLYGSYPLAVVSARDERGTRMFLERFDLMRYFRVIVTGQTAEHTKPYPDPVLYAANALGVPPERCLMVGDTTVDVRAGRAAGAQSVGVLCGFGEEAELRRSGADLILERTPQLAEVLIPA